MRQEYMVLIGRQSVLQGEKKVFLIAPKYAMIRTGDKVIAKNCAEYEIVFTDDYHHVDDELSTALRILCGEPLEVSKIIALHELSWEDDEDVDG